MAGHKGIYCTPDNIVPNRDKVNCNPIEETQLWVLEYEVDKIGKGCAMAKASNANEAISMLKAGGMYNGTPHLYKVTRVEQIMVPPCIGLMAEQMVTYE